MPIISAFTVVCWRVQYADSVDICNMLSGLKLQHLRDTMINNLVVDALGGHCSNYMITHTMEFVLEAF